MKNIFTTLLLLAGIAGFSQVKAELSDKFDFNVKDEQNPQLVLVDNYNYFLLSVVNTDGMIAKRQMIVRKFDQKNQLVNTFTYDFPKFDIGTLYNYIGFADSNGKVAVFTDTYSGKAKKSAIVKHEFDKATSEFKSTEVFSTPILSTMKSGTALLAKSENGRYIAINYTAYRAKGEPENNHIAVLETATLNTVLEKDFPFADEFVTSDIVLTNSGKAVFTRRSKGWKAAQNYLVLASAEGPQEIKLDEEITLQKPTCFSIGDQDYLLAFNAPAKGVRRGDFGKLLMLDLTTGKAIQNTDIDGFNAVKDIKEVLFPKISVENNEIKIFTECKVELEMKQTQTVGNFNSNFEAKTYKYGPAFLVILNLDGTLKSKTDLEVDAANANAELFHSFGVINIKGTYYLHTGYYRGFSRLNADKAYAREWMDVIQGTGQKSAVYHVPNTGNRFQFVPQLLRYVPDSNKLITARIFNGTQMEIMTFSNITF